MVIFGTDCFTICVPNITCTPIFEFKTWFVAAHSYRYSQMKFYSAANVFQLYGLFSVDLGVIIK